MLYLSTRGGGHPLPFRATVLTGLAVDGGLFVPAEIPRVADRLPGWQRLPFPALFGEIATLFAGGDPAADTLGRLIAESCRRFDHPEIVPVVTVGGIEVVELFHGPTLAFKDVALQFLGNLFAHYLAESGRRLTIAGATSGDTGSAAIHALRGKPAIEVFILFPRGRVTPMQERQMTTVPDANIHAVAIEGTFDDAQDIVKGLFNDPAFNAEVSLGAVNSINWARIMAQLVYYFHAYLRLAERGRAGGRPFRLGDPVRVAVPTGNFGNIYSGYLARRMGLPIEKLILATNANDILHRFVETGVYRRGGVEETLSPSMDIQVSSNFERYLFELAGRDAACLNGWLQAFAATGELAVAGELLAQVQRDFASARVDDEGTLETIRAVQLAHGYLLDPHSAIGYRAAQQQQQAQGAGGSPLLSLATAHPAKFAEAIRRAIGRDPELPPALARLQQLPTRVQELPARLDAVRDFIRETLRPVPRVRAPG
ncbi:MAG: threonine synthase [Candidatus Lambdaproteobacteria bacterium]|nr:threonine synthase [Candidatus Lambdaproteobacteria bacterium]